MASLYDRLGGEAAIDTAVLMFYRKMLSDKRVSGYFDNTDMETQIAKQKGFLTMAFGGPNNYTGKNMRDAHAPLVAKGLNGTHVDIVIEHLGGTLKELGVSDADIAEVAAIANSVRNDVIGA